MTPFPFSYGSPFANPDGGGGGCGDGGGGGSGGDFNIRTGNVINIHNT